ncbi:hypothetical protein B0920_06555 [Massilia sp. KIM]|uniref:GGDEF domain-containing protein n=1 Tax=Massilia sp. KIM TaxID=1955422 RepID=UPI00098EE181|nr:GGDEF domain-containing protein [Massilia sp. KIM]OON63070.1 hypothetical protein B0920_06555 [Massilia sp. KIM]
MDTFTLVLASALAGAIMAGSMALLYLAGSRKPWLLDWALAGFFFFASSVLGAYAAKFGVTHFLLPGFGNAFYLAGHFGILAGLRRQLGLDPCWKLLGWAATAVLAVHFLPIVHGSVVHRLFLFTPLIVGVNLAVAATPWLKLGREAYVPYLPLTVLELVFMCQLSMRAAYLILSEGHRLTFMGSQFLQTSGSLFVLVFLSVATMCCALIVSHEQSRELRRASITDALTGWLNRRALHEVATRAYQRCLSRPAGMVFLAFDIDHFKAVNDRHGHAAGDAAIRHVAAMAAAELPGCEARFRTGGEEFAVLLTDMGLERARELAERMRARIAANPLQTGGESLGLTVSVGLAALAPGDLSWEEVLRRADTALYQAKQLGRNRVCVAAAGAVCRHVAA